MKMTTRVSLIFALVITFPLTAFPCGTERWTVKVAQDKHIRFLFKDYNIDTGKLRPWVNTTIFELTKWQWPFPGPNAHPPMWSWTQRASKAEGAIWRVDAYLLKKKNEVDQDYHLVLLGGTKTLVAEIPHPVCVADTPEPLRSMIIKAREDFDEWFAAHHNEGPNFHQKVRVWGIVMFDTKGHAEGTRRMGLNYTR